MNKSIAIKAFWTIAFIVKESVVASASDGSVNNIINANTIQSFFDNEAPLLMDETHIAGMVVSAVHNNRVVFKKGYGYANIEQKQPVDADDTLFRVGSVSKLFTWTAILQLLEQGKVRLDEDINTYLKLGDFQLNSNDDAFSSHPITLSHIMSHTPGFEDFLFNLFVKDHEQHETLEQSIKRKIHLRRVRPPGKEISYSNYGAMLGGYIVQLVSGMPFESYVEEHIFKPLDMNRSTFRQPLPNHLINSLAGSYSYKAGSNFTLWPHFEFVQGTPVGGMSSSAKDMAKFLLANLSPDLGGILKEETVQKFHSTLFRPHPSVNGMAHGMIEMSTNGQRILGHVGDLIYHHSVFAFIPKEDFGVFVSMSYGQAQSINYKLYEKMMDHFFPSPTGKEVAEKLDACTDLSLYPGTYLANRRSESDMTKLISLAMKLKIEKTKNETLKTFNFFTQEYQEYVQVEPDVFQEVDGHQKIAFLHNNNGSINGLIWASLPIITFKRAPLWELPVISASILVVAGIVVLLMLLSQLFGLVKKFSRKENTSQPKVAIAANRLATAVAVLNIIFVILVVMPTNQDFIFAGVPPHWPFYIPWVAYLVGLLLPWYSYYSWKNGFWSLGRRIIYLVFTITMQLWFGVLWYWRVVPHMLWNAIYSL